jgi:thymidylate kinase
MGSLLEGNVRHPRNVVLEGLDQAGKSTIATMFSARGYHVVHSPYNLHHKDIRLHYQMLIETSARPVVFDRSFLAEVVYGPVLRGVSRLSPAAFQELLGLLAESNFAILYVRENIAVIRARLLQTQAEHAPILVHLAQLVQAYDRCMDSVIAFVPVYTLCPSVDSVANIVDQIAYIPPR